MSLDFNLSAIQDYKTVCYKGEEMDPTCHLLIFATMSVGLNAITAVNIDEWRWRIAFLNQLKMPVGYTSRGKGKGSAFFMPRPSVLQPFIGLRTNVSPESRAHWTNRMMKFFRNECERNATREAKLGAEVEAKSGERDVTDEAMGRTFMDRVQGK